MGYYYYYGARRAEPTYYSFLDGFTLSPLPYPVLLILAVICIFLGIPWFSSYEEAVEIADEGINWLLLAIPISIVFMVRWLSSVEDSNRCYKVSFYEPQRQGYYYCGPSLEGRSGVSPWGVAALIILLLVLINTNPSS